MRVDLPAPFSPTSACTVPRRTVRCTSEAATTPGKRLVMPCSSTAGGSPAGRSTAVAGSAGGLAMAHAPGRAPRPSAFELGLGGHLDLAADDLLLVFVDLGLDVVHLAAGGRVVHPAGLEVVHLLPGLHGVVLERGDEVVHRHVDLLDHR